MIETEPTVNPAGRYSSKQAAYILGIHRNTLKKYTDLGLIKFCISQTNGRKFYTGAEIKKFWITKY